MRVPRFLVLCTLATCASVSRADLATLPLADYPDFAVAGRPATYTKNELCNMAAQVAAINDLPKPFFTNLINQESGFQPDVVSRAGAQGIAQFMPNVAAANGLKDPFEPTSALLASGKLLAELVAQFGNLGLAAAAYNGGPRRVQEWLDGRGLLPSETKLYVFRITGYSAEHWAGPGLAAEVLMPAIAHCPGLDELGKPVRSADTTEKRTLIVKAGGLRRGLPQPNQFAIGVPVTRMVEKLERNHKRRAAWANRREPAMTRFLAMATPTILREEKGVR